MTRIATTTSINLIRHNKRRPESTFTDLTTEENEWLDNTLAILATGKERSIEDHLVAADLADKVLFTLPPDDRLILMLIDVDHAPVKEVAEMTGWSESKVKVKAFRARRRMRQAVEKLLKGAAK